MLNSGISIIRRYSEGKSQESAPGLIFLKELVIIEIMSG
jgi:hypothetical protein